MGECQGVALRTSLRRETRSGGILGQDRRLPGGYLIRTPHSAGQGHLDGPGELDAIVRCAQFKRILPVPGVTEVVFGTRTSVMLQPTILSGDIYTGSSPVLS